MSWTGRADRWLLAPLLSLRPSLPASAAHSPSTVWLGSLAPYLHLRVDDQVQVALAVARLLILQPKVRARGHVQAGRQHLQQ